MPLLQPKSMGMHEGQAPRASVHVLHDAKQQIVFGCMIIGLYLVVGPFFGRRQAAQEERDESGRGDWDKLLPDAVDEFVRSRALLTPTTS